MKNKTLFSAWLVLYILCAFLGFFRGEGGDGLMSALSLFFFVPPAVLLYRAKQKQDAGLLRRIRKLSALSLGATAAVLVLSFLTVLAPDWVGTFLHVVLVLVSAPMIASGYWAVSLFFWACLLVASSGKKRN